MNSYYMYRPKYMATFFRDVKYKGYIHFNVQNEITVSELSCKRNQLGAQYSQYISSILFITSACFGPLQVHRQEE